MASQIQLRRDTEANWIASDPILAQGEIAINLDDFSLKIGDGTHKWSELSDPFGATLAEIETSSLGIGEGSGDNGARAGELLRAIYDEMGGSGESAWDALTSEHTGVGSFGLLVATDIDAKISEVHKQVAGTGDGAGTIGKILYDLNANITATRAGYLDNLSAGAVALASNCDAKVSDIHKQTAGTGDGAGTIGKILFDLNANITAARAGYLDNLSLGAVMLASSYTAPDNSTISTISTNLGAPVTPDTSVNTSLHAIMHKNSSHTFDPSTDALEAISENIVGMWTALGIDTAAILEDVQWLYDTAEGGSYNYPLNAVNKSIIAKMISKTANGGNITTYDCTTDSQEAVSDKLGGFSGDGGAAQDDSAKASLDLLHTSVADVHKQTAGTGDGAGTIGKILFDLNANVTATRAGYLDNLSGGAVALASNCDAKISEVHKQAAGTGDGAGTIGKILYDLNANITATRAGYLDNLSGGAVALASNCDAKVSEVHKQTAGTGDGAGTIGKILYDLNANITSARAGYIDLLSSGLDSSGLDAGGGSADDHATVAQLSRYSVDALVSLILTLADVKSAMTLLQNVTGRTTMGQETSGAVTANGTNWVDLLDKSTLSKPTYIRAYKVTTGGTWVGKFKFRITNGSGTKIWPHGDYLTEGTDEEAVSGELFQIEEDLLVLQADGYKVQFCSTSGSDTTGKTLTLTQLDVTARG